MIVCGTLLFVILLQNWIHKSKNKKYKPILFGLFGLTYLIPYSHFMLSEIFFDNFGDPFKFSHSNFWWFMSSFSFLFGLYIFIKKYFIHKNLGGHNQNTNINLTLSEVVIKFGIFSVYVESLRLILP